VYTSTKTYEDPIDSGADQQGSALLDPRTYGRSTSVLEGGCPTARAAAEALFLFNSTSPIHDIGFAAGWFRKQTPGCNSTDTLGSGNSTLLWCTPTLVHGRASVTVDGDGNIFAVDPFNASSMDMDRYIPKNDNDTTKTRLIRNANFHFVGHGAPVPWKEPTHPATEPAFALTNWHNDTFPGDFVNYFIAQLDPSKKAALDPALPPPSLPDIAPLIADVYARVFAVLLGSRPGSFLKAADIGGGADADADAAAEDVEVIKGHVIRPEVRVLMSKPLFCISEAILGLYILVTVLLYCNRPKASMPRYPTTVASVVAFFAAGQAVRDFKGTGGLSGKEREKVAGRLGGRYAYGRFVGADGGVYVGLERAELVSEWGMGFSGWSAGGSGISHRAAVGGKTRRAKGRGWRMPFRRQDNGSIAF